MASISGMGNVQITYWCAINLILNKPPNRKKLGGVRSGDLAGHVMCGDHLPIHLEGNCSSKNVQAMLAKCGVAPTCW